MTVPVFEVRDATYRYHEVTALDGLNLTVMPGQRIALLGANRKKAALPFTANSWLKTA